MKQKELNFGDAAPGSRESTASYICNQLADASSGQLVARILGCADESVRDYFDSLSLATLPETPRLEFLRNCPGLSECDFEKLKSSIELGRRIAEQKSLARLPRVAISSTTVAISYCRERYGRLISDATREEFHILTLDTKNRIIDAHRISVGTLNASLIHPREVFRPAILDCAASIIAVHNHPSGDPKPSKEDYSVTERLTRVGESIGIDLLDHIVVARDGVVSIREVRPSNV